jgi:hypothetical protein
MKADEVSKQNIIGILEAVAGRGARYRSNRVLALFEHELVVIEGPGSLIRTPI